MDDVVGAAVDPRYYFSLEDIEIEEVVENLNNYLQYDGVQLVPIGRRYHVRKAGGALVESPEISFELDSERHEFIAEEITKCESRIAEGDFTVRSRTPGR